MKKIKVLFILRDIGFGGTERQMVELCQGINKDKFDISVALFFDNGGFISELRNTGADVRILSTKNGYKLSVLFRLVKLIKEKNPDIVQTFLPIANFFGALAANICGKTTVTSLRADYFTWKDIFCLMDLAAFNLCSEYVNVNSLANQQCALKHYKVASKKIRLIYNGKNPDNYKITKDRVILRKELGIPDNAIIVASIGRVTEQKGFKYLIEAASIIKKRTDKKLVFLIIGKPQDTYAALLEQRRDLGLEEDVIFLGVRKDVADILKIADIFVLPSLWEGLANVLLEAMFARRPIITTNILANTEVIADNRTGLLVAPGDGLAIADAVIMLLENTEFARKLGEAAYNEALNKFSVEKLAGNFESFYEEIHAGNR